MELLRSTVPPEAAPTTVGRYLAGALGLSTTLVKRLKMHEGIRVNGEVVHTPHRLAPGDEVVLSMTLAPAPGVDPEPVPLVIVAEDRDLVVIDKPPGLVVHPTKGVYHGTVANGLAWRYRERGEEAGIHPLHRIDRNTSGLVVFAKHPLAHQRLDAQLQANKLERLYLALVWGEVAGEGGRIDRPIGLVAGHPVAREVHEAGQPSVTHYEVVRRFAGMTLVRLRLETGRTHQIRVHMAAIGHPLVGDDLYASDRPPALGRQALHAATLGFKHPRSGETLRFESPLPEDMAALLDRLGGGASPSVS